MMMYYWCAAFLLLATVLPADSAVVRIGDTEYPNLKAALYAARDLDEVLLEEGLYDGPDNAGLDIKVNITIRGKGKLTEIDFGRNMSHEAFMSINKTITIEDLTLKNGETRGIGSCVAGDGTDYTINRVTFIRCRGEAGVNSGCAFGVYGGTSYIRNCNFSDSIGDVYLQRGATVHVYDSVFNKTGIEETRQFGGNFVIFRLCHLFVDNCRLGEARAFIGARAGGYLSLTVSIKNSVFDTAIGTLGAIYTNYGTTRTGMTMSNCTFKNHRAATLFLVQAPDVLNIDPIIVRDVVIEDSVATDSVFKIQNDPRNDVSIVSGITLRNVTAKTALFVVEHGSFEASDILIDGGVDSNTLRINKGFIFAMGATARLERIHLSNIESSALVVTEDARVTLSNCTIQDSRFDGETAFLFLSEQAVVAMQDIQIVGNVAKTGFILLANGNASVSLSNVFVLNNQAYSPQGGVIGVQDNAKLRFVNSSIISNKAKGNGGAITIGGINSDVSLSGVEIRNNSAFQGGAINVLSGYECATRVLDFRNVTFIENKAEAGGGGIYYHDNTPMCMLNLERATFHGNNAGYGENQATSAVKLVLEGTSSTAGDEELAIINDFISVPPYSDATFDVRVHLTDFFNQVVVEDQLYGIQLKSSNPNFQLIGETCAVIKKGHAHFSEVSVSGRTDQLFTVTVESSRAGTSLPYVFKIATKICPVGTEDITSRNGSMTHCKDCPLGMYNLVAGMKCKDCPNGAICKGRDKVLVSYKTYVEIREVVLSEELKNDHRFLIGQEPILVPTDKIVRSYKCGYRHCCEEKTCELKNQCGKNREGFLCGSCIAGHAVVGLQECVACTSANGGGIFLIVFLSALIGIWTLFLGPVIMSVEKRSGKIYSILECIPSAHSLFLFSYVSYLFLTDGFHPATGRVAAALSFSPASFLSSPMFCLGNLDPLVRRMCYLVIAMLPFCFAAIFAISGKFILRLHNFSALDSFRAAACRIFLFTQMFVSRTTLEVLVCVRYQDRLLLQHDPSVECMTGAHRIIHPMMFVFYALWTGIVPLVLLHMFYQRRLKRKDYQNRMWQWFGVFVFPYKMGFEELASIDFLRKSLLVILSVCVEDPVTRVTTMGLAAFSYLLFYQGFSAYPVFAYSAFESVLLQEMTLIAGWAFANASVPNNSIFTEDVHPSIVPLFIVVAPIAYCGIFVREYLRQLKRPASFVPYMSKRLQLIALRSSSSISNDVSLKGPSNAAAIVVCRADEKLRRPSVENNNSISRSAVPSALAPSEEKWTEQISHGSSEVHGTVAQQEPFALAKMGGQRSGSSGNLSVANEQSGASRPY